MPGNIYTSDDGTRFMVVPFVEDDEDWTAAYEVRQRDALPAGYVFCETGDTTQPPFAITVP